MFRTPKWLRGLRVMGGSLSRLEGSVKTRLGRAVTLSGKDEAETLNRGRTAPTPKEIERSRVGFETRRCARRTPVGLETETGLGGCRSTGIQLTSDEARVSVQVEVY